MNQLGRQGAFSVHVANMANPVSLPHPFYPTQAQLDAHKDTGYHATGPIMLHLFANSVEQDLSMDRQLARNLIASRVMLPTQPYRPPAMSVPVTRATRTAPHELARASG